MKWSPALQFSAFVIVLAAGFAALALHLVTWKELGIGGGSFSVGALLWDRFFGLSKGDS